MTFHYQETLPGTFTTILYGNIKNPEKTASAETSHRVNDIAIQANFNRPECRQPIPDNNKYKRRSTCPTPQILLVRNAGHIVGPSKTQLETPMQLQIILHSCEISRCRIKGFLHGVEGDCHKTCLWCNIGQKYHRALRKLKNVYQA